MPPSEWLKGLHSALPEIVMEVENCPLNDDVLYISLQTMMLSNIFHFHDYFRACNIIL